MALVVWVGMWKKSVLARGLRYHLEDQVIVRKTKLLCLPGALYTRPRQ